MNWRCHVTLPALWLQWNQPVLDLWDWVMVPWMKTETFAQVLAGGMESALLMERASGELIRTSIEAAHRWNVALMALLSPKVGQTPRTVIWTRNKARLYQYHHSAEMPVPSKTSLLIVYALINKPSILDLLPQRSFISYLVNKGIDVYLLEWGIPGPEDKHLRFDDLVLEYMPQAVQQVLKASGRKRLHLFGYCIGGILSTLYAAMYPDAPLDSLLLLATPIDFSPPSVLGTWLNPRTFDVDTLVDGAGNISPTFIFTGARLLSLIGATSLLKEFAQDEQASAVWRAISLWAMDSVPFPGEAFRQLVKDFYQSNKLITDQLTLAGQPVHLSSITLPLLNIGGQEDYLVPPSQIKPLFEKVSSTEKTLILAPGSHFAPVIGQQAICSLWPREVDWLVKHSRL